ncbi:MAG: hypothetical protein ACRBCI_06235 [Cellvibrionaceae bacterium]
MKRAKTISINDPEIADHLSKITRYIEAKDSNRPYLMASVFSETAILKMAVNSDSISFPSDTLGLTAISDLLSRKFNQQYENIYTFCLTDSFVKENNTLSCQWWVGMTDKESKDIKVGYGQYDWIFDSAESDNIVSSKKVTQLTITIDNMIVLSPNFTHKVIDWLKELPYPFCESDIFLKTMPAINELEAIRKLAFKD